MNRTDAIRSVTTDLHARALRSHTEHAMAAELELKAARPTGTSSATDAYLRAQVHATLAVAYATRAADLAAELAR